MNWESEQMPIPTLPDLSDEELVERLLAEVLGDHPRAEQWRLWREALEERLGKLLKEKERAETEDAWDERIEELRRYIAALREEEIITEFVEQQVRMVVGKARLEQQLGERLEEG